MNANLKTFTALVRRELWEHRGFWLVPTVITSVMTVVFLRFGYELLTGDHAHEVARINERLGTSGALDSFAVRTDAMASFFMASSMFVFVIMGFVLFFYALDCLYGDRRDKSVLFWRSMPVTDVQTVLAKLFTAAFAGPLTTLAVLAAAFVVWGGLGALFGYFGGIEQWWIGLNPLAILQALVTMVGIIGGCALILAPFLGWLLVASAWAPRAPFLWAVLPPLGIAMLEKMVFDTHVFFDTIADQKYLVSQLFEGSEFRHGIGLHISGSTMRYEGGIHLSTAFLAEPRLWVGLAIAAGFVAAAVYIRRFRDEAAY